ncbi:MAG TPA: 50S ribosomal protein L14e [Candidatus Altiarchaeales archaeon]|nr:50S ribosomal protein L14e [Candidatus Altiarchaeales archaeon]
MAIMTVGRVCRKTKGRDALETCVILDTKGKKALVEGENARKKEVSFAHLEPTPHMLDVDGKTSSKKIAESLANLG